jgi:DNA-directed RNA polymerase specialized sigma24 family protein
MKRRSENYINNKEFSQAVFSYVEECNECKKLGKEVPVVPNYVALGFQQISEGLSHRPNFISYSYRDEMVMDAVENCLKAIRNYNIEAATRTGNPNAFAYFTQIAYYAFLRRIAKEKKQQEIKDSYFENTFAADLIEASSNQDDTSKYITHAAIETAKMRMNDNKELTDDEYIDIIEDALPKKRIRKTNDSDLTDFL